MIIVHLLAAALLQPTAGLPAGHARLAASSPPTLARTHRRPSRAGLATSQRRVARANALATLAPDPQRFVNVVQVYPFAEGALYDLYAAPGRVTDIVLQPGEALVAVAAGDTARWTVGDTTSGSGTERRTHVLVKPFTYGLSTNLVITTDRRTYHVSLASQVGPAMTGLAWSYPQDGLLALGRTGPGHDAARPVATMLGLDRLHFDYRISGDKPAWRPLRAFDDGRQTFIEFPATLPNSEAPPLFVIDANGAASLVNYRLAGSYYVVDRIFDVAELRLGARRQQVVRITRSGRGHGRGTKP